MTPIIIGKSVRGESHIRRNTECQDSFLIIDGIHKHDRSIPFYDEMPDDVKIIAVADGHGSESCPYSRTGAKTAVNVFCDIMAEYAAKYRDNRDELFKSLNREGETTRIAKWIVGEWGKRILQHHKMEKREVLFKENGDADADAIYKQYGSTLLGMMITQGFSFSFQLGDGDITYVDKNEVAPVIEGDKILGTETHSISKKSSWKKTLTRVISFENGVNTPFMFVLSTDGWLNSHSSIDEFNKTCRSYFEVIQEKGLKTVENNLEGWLSETSTMGCGDDITTVFAYFPDK